jgi:hypothetical protein
MQKEPFHVVEMEQKLREDTSGQMRDMILKQLKGHQMQLKSTLASSLTPEDFKALSELQKAIEQAEVVVESYWLIHHSKS